MNSDHQGGEHHVEKLDADAVCIECSTVNAEGTLLCKVCGNNLRDQRSRRLMSDQVLEAGPGEHPLKKWLSPVMFILAVGLIISTLYNQEAIVDWLVSTQSDAQRGPDQLWQGEGGRTIDQLTVDLQDRLPTEEEAFAARANPVAGGTLDGIYVLFDEDVFVGSANVLEDGDKLVFAVVLESGDQVRGQATLQGNHYIMTPSFGGVNLRNRIIPIQGVASPRGLGVLECVGDDSQFRYSCTAYRLGS